MKRVISGTVRWFGYVMERNGIDFVKRLMAGLRESISGGNVSEFGRVLEGMSCQAMNSMC